MGYVRVKTRERSTEDELERVAGAMEAQERAHPSGATRSASVTVSGSDGGTRMSAWRLARTLGNRRMGLWLLRGPVYRQKRDEWDKPVEGEAPAAKENLRPNLFDEKPAPGLRPSPFMPTTDSRPTPIQTPSASDAELEGGRKRTSPSAPDALAPDARARSEREVQAEAEQQAAQQTTDASRVAGQPAPEPTSFGQDDTGLAQDVGAPRQPAGVGPEREEPLDAEEVEERAEEETPATEATVEEALGEPLQAGPETRARIAQLVTQAQLLAGQAVARARGLIAALMGQALALPRTIAATALRVLQAASQRVATLASRALGLASGLIANLAARVQGWLARLRSRAAEWVERLTSLGGDATRWVHERIEALKRAAHARIVTLVRQARLLIIGHLRQTANTLAMRVTQLALPLRLLVYGVAGHVRLVLQVARIHLSALLTHRLAGPPPVPGPLRQTARRTVRAIVSPLFGLPARLLQATAGRGIGLLRAAFGRIVAATQSLWSRAAQLVRSVFAAPLAVAQETVPEAVAEIQAGVAEAEEIGTSLQVSADGQVTQLEGTAALSQAMLDAEAAQSLAL